ncbi:MAG: aquaporin [Casimicrobiaceae bacterium]
MFVLITSLGPISGAHFNPAVTVALAVIGEFSWREVLPYIGVQVVAALARVGNCALDVRSTRVYRFHARRNGPQPMVERKCRTVVL